MKDQEYIGHFLLAGNLASFTRHMFLRSVFFRGQLKTVSTTYIRCSSSRHSGFCFLFLSSAYTYHAVEETPLAVLAMCMVGRNGQKIWEEERSYSINGRRNGIQEINSQPGNCYVKARKEPIDGQEARPNFSKNAKSDLRFLILTLSSILA